MKINIVIIILYLACAKSFAQDLNNVQFPLMQKVSAHKDIKLPNILGYTTLKCDFHMHTVFSDGIVWPTYRVTEAWEEGLDAIAITDHIEKQPSKKYVSGDHNASYEIAKQLAIEKNILLVHAGEVTREMPPGHLNALFLSDVNLLDTPDPIEALGAAKKQGAFIVWNHPGWKAQQPDTCLWMPMHQELFDKGLINGIEVFNEQEFYPIVLDWCLNRNMAVICNSDIHDVTANFYDLQNGHRPMTLVFAKDRSLESLKEALFANRTLAWFDNKLAGKEEFLRAFFEASVTIKPIAAINRKSKALYEISNVSAIPYDIETSKGDKLFIPAESSLILPLDSVNCKGSKVRNLFTGSRSNLKVDLF